MAVGVTGERCQALGIRGRWPEPGDGRDGKRWWRCWNVTWWNIESFGRGWRMRKAKVDDNQKIIVEALRRAGHFVQSLASLGGGCPDLLIGSKHGRWLLLEIKDGSKVQSKRTLTTPEIRWILAVENRAPVYVVESVEQALEVVARAAA
jgi:hypothetical protein